MFGTRKPLIAHRFRFAAFLVATALAMTIAGGGAFAAGPQPQQPRLDPPDWLTADMRQQVRKAGPNGKDTPTDLIDRSCPGAGPTVPGVQAGTCLVYPYGCTANFVYYKGPTIADPTGALRPAGGAAGTPLLPPFTSDGQKWFLGTAGHCLKGGPVFAQVRAPGVYVPNSVSGGAVDSSVGGIAEIGAAAKKVNGGIGNDFGTIQIKAGFTVTPATPLGAPHGVFTDCLAPLPIDYYGHGYHFAVTQGKGGAGAAFWPSTDWYTWAGTAYGGDSGSGVTLPDLEAVGNLTHGLGIIDGIVPLPVGYGTRMTKIFSILGRGFYLVNADGSLSRATSSCAGLDAPWDPLVGVH
jgi:hypothetical protein